MDMNKIKEVICKMMSKILLLIKEQLESKAETVNADNSATATPATNKEAIMVDSATETTAAPAADEAISEPNPEPETTAAPVADEAISAAKLEHNATSAVDNVTEESQHCQTIIPEDSVLKRHYFTHIHAMSVSLLGTRPEDAVLSRHYNTLIATRLEECLSCDKAMTKLTSEYENHRKLQNG